MVARWHRPSRSASSLQPNVTTATGTIHRFGTIPIPLGRRPCVMAAPSCHMKGAHESLLRTLSSRTGSCGSQSFVDLPDAPHFIFRYMVHDITDQDVLRTYLVPHTAQFGSMSLSDQCLDVSPAVNPTPISSREQQKCIRAQHTEICVSFTMFTASAGTKERHPCRASPLSQRQPPSSLTATVPTIAMLNQREG
ncbi:uncharacterized protein M421DRAFT_90708 [Didymella exigua CBS 183.55]|uniref:Uncharacterized protein n=1 Tax=Didymella exigua CBS 183.55 TaxID=1150837 RepID=A0A6A5RTR0_9PLEO|nr:uncharacterized protein M421DRAFT_90708 [Didymella exigua CBS 183.55]KAF1930929.1 hypothetical protein M421DRAFT_90708 [Didymella exigua CBS 183.55]